MRFISNNKELVLKYFFTILFLFIFSCTDEEVRPFVGKTINIHTSNKSMASSNFTVNLNQVTTNDYWIQKGGNHNHIIPNINLKFPLKKIFSKNTDQELSDKYFSLANPVSDEKNIFILSTNGNVTSINNNNFKINWKKKFFLINLIS